MYGGYKDEDHNSISRIEQALIEASRYLEDVSVEAHDLLERNPDKAVMIKDLIDEIYSVNKDVENIGTWDDLHQMFQAERGENYWEDAD